jgi:DDE domain
MVLAPSVAGLFKWRQFEPEVILLAVGWYLRFSLSYRDVEELLAERGLHADHVTVWRWVQRYAPEMERRLRSRLKQTNDSWRVDETYIRVKGKWVYLYRSGPRSKAKRGCVTPPSAKIAPADVLPRLDHGHIAAIPRGLREDYRASRRPLLRHLLERSLKKAIISARWMAGQRDDNIKKSALQR